MKKTPIDHPDDLKPLEKISRTTGRRQAAMKGAVIPRPRVPLLDRGLGDSTIAENVDALRHEKFGR